MYKSMEVWNKTICRKPKFSTAREEVKMAGWRKWHETG